MITPIVFCAVQMLSQLYTSVIFINLVISCVIRRLDLCLVSSPRHVPVLRHKINNYFLNSYRHFWLGRILESSDSDSLLAVLTVT